ncbi:MAG: hypothetical protein MUE85_20315 [Microscillaceae bacterium]|jgi:hypothetical protein|nr:hypothetical protein [Microscillaceae bacterium]
MTIYAIFLMVHSWLRWLVLLVAILLIIRSFMGWFGKKSYESGDNRLAVFFIIFMHLQLVLGLVLYFFLSPKVQIALQDMGKAMKNPELRAWSVEHITMMLLAVVVAQLGRSFSKKRGDSVQKHRTLAIYTLIALVLMLAGIPWKFAGTGF